MTDAPNSGSIPVKTLPVWPTVYEAYGFWFRHFRTWLKLIILPTIVIVFGIVMLTSVSMSLPGELRGIAHFFLACLVLVPMITAWHRLVLSGAGQARGWLATGRREWRYLRLAILLFVAGIAIFLANFAAIGALSGAVPASLWFILDAWLLVLGFLVAYALIAVLPVLPAAAIGQEVSVKQALLATRGQRWQIFFMYVLAAIPLAGLSIAIRSFVTPIAGDLNPYIAAYLNAATDYAMIVVSLPSAIAIASISYRELVQADQSACERTITPASAPSHRSRGRLR